MSNDPRIIREGGYQGTMDPGPPPSQLYDAQIVTVVRPVNAQPLALRPNPPAPAQQPNGPRPA